MANTPLGELQLNQRLGIEIDDGPCKGSYSSYTVDIADEGITVAAPMVANRVIALPVGTLLRVIYVDDCGVYGFPAAVAGRKQDATQLLILARLGPVEKVQRRNFVRLSTSLAVKYMQYPDKNAAEVAARSEEEFRPGRIVDISGGGIQLAAAERMGLYAYLLLEFYLPDGYRIRSLGEIVRIIPRTGKAKESREHFYGIRFVRLEPRVQDRLVKFIFEEQMLLRRKGLL